LSHRRCRYVFSDFVGQESRLFERYGTEFLPKRVPVPSAGRITILGANRIPRVRPDQVALNTDAFGVDIAEIELGMA
jgi:hypothetical protein